MAENGDYNTTDSDIKRNYGLQIPKDFPNIEMGGDPALWWSRMRPLMLEMAEALDSLQLRVPDVGGGGSGGSHTTYQSSVAGPSGYAGNGAPTMPPTSFIVISIPNVIVTAGQNWSWKAYTTIEELGTGGTAWMRIVNLTDSVATPYQQGFCAGTGDPAALSIQVDGTQQGGDMLFPTAGTKTIQLELGGTFGLTFQATDSVLSGSIITP